MNINLPESFSLVSATNGPVTTNGGVTGVYVSLKNVVKAWLVLQFTQAAGHATTPAIKQASAIAGTGVKTGPTSPVWANEDSSASDALVRKTAGASYAVTNDIKKKMVVFEIDPATLDTNNGFDVAGFSIADSAQATNFVSGLWVLQQRYQQATPPSAIVD